MDFTTQLHLTAGLAALGLGAGALLREPGRGRNRIFAALCAALSLWLMGVAGSLTRLAPEAPWHRLYLLGSCLSAPLALHFSLVTAGRWERRSRTAGLVPAYGAAAGLWLTSWSGLYGRQPLWNIAAALVLGVIFLAALATILRRVRSLARGPERDAYRMLLAGSAVAVAGGLSDFLPRGGLAFPPVGPAALMVLLVIISGLVIRRRFLDIGPFLARSVALVVGATAAAVFLHAVALSSGNKLLPVFLATLLVLLLAGPLGRLLVAGAGSLLEGGLPAAGALMESSQRISDAESPGEAWAALQQGLSGLDQGITYGVFTGEAGGTALGRVGGSDALPGSLPVDGPLVRLLDAERAPVTRLVAEEQARSGDPGRRAMAAGALETMRRGGIDLVVPLHHEDRVVGLIALGGGRRERYMRTETAASLTSLGHQALGQVERLEMQEESRRRRALAAVGELAAGLAHEIRNPVSAIHGAAQVIAGETDAARRDEMLRVIEEESGRLGRFAGEFLEYARPAAVEPVPLDLAELARRSLRSAAAAGMRIRGEVDEEDGVPRALADAEQIQRVLDNLVRNTWEAAGDDGALQVRVQRAGAGRVSIRLRDDGPGIPRERLETIFQPFQTTKPRGTGLGLALAHRIVEAHGGRIRAETGSGPGAVFTVELPAAP